MASVIGRKARLNESKVPQAELQAAVRKFIASGGIIKKLPDEKTASAQVVGVRWSSTEMAGEPG
jgi:hypothetical protein